MAHLLELNYNQTSVFLLP